MIRIKLFLVYIVLLFVLSCAAAPQSNNVSEESEKIAISCDEFFKESMEIASDFFFHYSDTKEERKNKKDIFLDRAQVLYSNLDNICNQISDSLYYKSMLIEYSYQMESQAEDYNSDEKYLKLLEVISQKGLSLFEEDNVGKFAFRAGLFKSYKFQKKYDSALKIGEELLALDVRTFGADEEGYLHERITTYGEMSHLIALSPLLTYDKSLECTLYNYSFNTVHFFKKYNDKKFEENSFLDSVGTYMINLLATSLGDTKEAILNETKNCNFEIDSEIIAEYVAKNYDPNYWDADYKNIKGLYKNNSIAVTQFTSSGISSEIATALSNEFEYEISKLSKDITVVERTQITKLLNEQGFQQSGVTDSEDAVKIGKLLGADYLVVGSVSVVGSTYSVTVKIVSVDEGSIIDSASMKHQGDIDHYLESGLKDIATELFVEE